MKSIAMLVCFAACACVLAGEDQKLTPAYEITYKTQEDRDSIAAEVRKLAFEHITQTYEGVLAEDNVVIHGQGFRVGYTIKGFCKDGDLVFLVFQTSLHRPREVKQALLVNQTRKKVREIR
jgi:hypothetical protein